MAAEGTYHKVAGEASAGMGRVLQHEWQHPFLPQLHRQQLVHQHGELGANVFKSKTIHRKVGDTFSWVSRKSLTKSSVCCERLKTAYGKTQDCT